MTDTDRMVVWLREAMDAAQHDAETAGGDEWRLQDHPSDVVAIYDSKGEPVVYDEGWPTEAQKAHIVRNSPAAMLRQIAADRKILDLHTTPHTVVELAVEPVGELFCGECDGPCTHKGEAECAICGQDGCDTLRLLAEGHGWKGGQP